MKKLWAGWGRRELAEEGAPTVIRFIFRHPTAPLFVVACLLAWARGLVPSPPPPPPPPPPSPSLLQITAPPPSLEHFVHDLVNDHRTGLGLKPLEYRQELAVIAHVHSLAMATYTTPYGHGGFDDRARRADNFMPSAGFAENVAMLNHRGQGGEAKAVVRGWLQSPGHRENIEGDFSLTGIGISQSWEGTYYFTQLFMTPAAAVEPAQSHHRDRFLKLPRERALFDLLPDPFQRLHDLRAAGNSQRAIAQILEAEGVHPGRYKKWNRETVRRILALADAAAATEEVQNGRAE